MGWQREGQYAIKNGRWAIAKYTVGDKARYVLWQDNGPDNRKWVAGPFDTADEAKDEWQRVQPSAR